MFTTRGSNLTSGISRRAQDLKGKAVRLRHLIEDCTTGAEGFECVHNYSHVQQAKQHHARHPPPATAPTDKRLADCASAAVPLLGARSLAEAHDRSPGSRSLTHS